MQEIKRKQFLSGAVEHQQRWCGFFCLTYILPSSSSVMSTPATSSNSSMDPATPNSTPGSLSAGTIPRSCQRQPRRSITAQRTRTFRGSHQHRQWVRQAFNYNGRAQDYTPWAASLFRRPWALQAASHGSKTQGHMNGAASHGGKTQGHVNGAASHGGKTEGHVPLGSKLWRQDTGPCALGSKSWRQDTGPCALGGKSQDHGSGRPQVMVARSHTLGSKFRTGGKITHPGQQV